MIQSKHITVSLHVLIWGAVLLLPFFFEGPDESYGQIGPLRCNFFTLANVIHIGLFYFNAFYLYPRLLTRRKWGFYMVWIVGLIAVLYHLKMLILVTWFPILAQAKTAFAFTMFPIVFFLLLSTMYRLVLDKLNHERERSQQQAEQLSTELKFLRSQVSPHFLFNVLNNLVSMARHKSNLLEPALIKLSGLMRYMLYDSAGRKVTLSAETGYLNDYIELQRLRFGDRVEIRVDMLCDEPKVEIEPMLLVPFVENAFKHGVGPIESPFIRITLKQEGKNLHFSVENKFGPGVSSNDKISGIGLANVRARLNLLYPDRHQLSVDEQNNVFVVNLHLELDDTLSGR
ncbi:MAG TPA: histidine kinase [Cyclobacteriaceae bacterium]